MSKNPITIKPGTKLGELDAEADGELLDTCYINNGQIDQILDVTSPSSVIVGRTGSGKSALLYKVSKEVEHSVILNPNDISVRFLEHSNIIQFFDEIGVRLDLFYRLLWRHILTVELLKLRYDIRTEAQNRNVLERIYSWVQRDSAEKRAVTYFQTWGDKFWLETDEQLREITSRLSEEVSAKIKSKHQGVEISAEGARAIGQEVKTQIKSLATQVVSSIQITRLQEVIDLLNENAFQDRQKRYYVLIDHMDEDWASTATRCRFTRALIEETKFLRRIPQVKIVTALRRDLIDLVFDVTRDSGFQQEKYEAYLVNLSWSKSNIKQILEARVSEVYKRQYTKDSVLSSDVFPKQRKQGAGDPLDFIIERTLLRPRDALQLANYCFETAANLNAPRISWRAMFAAEATYSKKRIESFTEEWGDHYPAIGLTIEVLRGLRTPFTRSNIDSSRVEDRASELCELNSIDPCVEAAKNLYGTGTKTISESDFVSEVLMCLYRVGAIGIKISTLDTFIWSHLDQPRVSKSEIKRANQIKVHKMIRPALEVGMSH